MSSKVIVAPAIIFAVGLIFFAIFYGGAPTNQSASIHGGVAEGGALGKETAPDFTLEKLSGGTISLAEFRGKKPVVVDFWASWCPNCQRDMPNLNRLYEKYRDRVEVIGINLQENESTVKKFIASRGISFPIALDPRAQASRVFGIRYTNTHALINRAGNLVRTIPGDIREADIISLIEQSVSSGNEGGAPNAEPCKVASAENGEKEGVCENSETL